MPTNLNPPTPPNSLKIAWKDIHIEAYGPIGITAVLIMVVGLVLLFAVTQ